MPVPTALPPTERTPLEQDLQRNRAALLEAELTLPAAQRYLAAQLAALRTAAVVLAFRARPSRSPRQQGPRNAWVVLAQVAPELGEWAAFFAATQGRRDAVRAGGWVGAREADDLLRDAQGFLDRVEQALPGSRARGGPPVRAAG